MALANPRIGLYATPKAEQSKGNRKEKKK